MTMGKWIEVRTMNRSWVVLAWWAIAAGNGTAGSPAVAASPDPKNLAIAPIEMSKARELVRRLGSDAFRERERALDELASMGRLAKPALVEALNADPNPEVRSRTAQLLPRAEAADLQARIDTFLADASGKYDHDLPAWGSFRKRFGGEKAARDLYVELLKSRPNLELLIAVGASPRAGGRAIADRRYGLYVAMFPQAIRGLGQGGAINTVVRPQQPTLADLAALLFAETVIPSSEIPRVSPFAFVTGAFFAQQQVSMAAVNNPTSTPHAEPFKRILLEWLDTRTAPEDLTGLVHVAQNLQKLRDPTPLFRRILNADGVQGYAKGQAVAYLVQRNGKAELPFLKTLLTNDTTASQAWNVGGALNQVTPVQLRDIALAYLIAQTGQDMKAYGYEFTANQAIVNQPNMGTYAFTTDEKRAAALKKWAAWEAAQKKDEIKK